MNSGWGALMKDNNRGLASFVSDNRGVATVEYIAIASVFMIVGVAISYQIIGDADGGLVALSEGKTAELQAASNDIDNIVAKASAFSGGSPGNSGFGLGGGASGGNPPSHSQGGGNN